MSDDLIVVVAAGRQRASLAGDRLRSLGAGSVWQTAFGKDRVSVYGFPFGPRAAVDAAASLRADGWAADVRPAGGGHLAAWLSHTRPVVVGDRLWVCFPWSEFTPPAEAGPVVVEIDPLGAFGTGAHPSTRLLLGALVTRLGGGESVLDVGSGSGVLAICAVRLGAARVAAVDVSAAARTATSHNAARNGVQLVPPGVQAACGLPALVGSSIDSVDDQYDVVLANIAAPTLRELAPSLEARVGPGGWLGLSGISPAQVSLVAAAFTRLTMAELVTDDDWAALILAER